MKKYGGVSNQKPLHEIQEARIVSAPGMSKITKKRSKASVLFGWLTYLVISYIIADLFLVIATDVYSKAKLPLWAIFLLPAVPFILTLALKVYAALYDKKHTNHKD